MSALDAYVKRVRVVGMADNGDINRVIATYSNPAVNSALTDGTQGQVMVELPRLWYKEYVDGDGHLEGVDIADHPRTGYTLHPCFSWGDGRDVIYIGAYEASGATHLQSISGVVPVTNIAMATFRSRAVARGGGTQATSPWHIMGFWQQHLIDLLFYAYYETRDSQLVLPGYTESSGWHTDYMRECGRSNILSAVNGSINAQLGGGEDDEDLSAVLTAGDKVANRFLFIENIFGHIWKFNDGVAYVPDFDFDAVDESLTPNGNMWNDDWGKDLQAVYHTADIRDFSSVATAIRDDYSKLDVVPVSITGDDEIQKTGKGFVPTAHGGTTGQNWCARFYGRLAATGRPSLRVVPAGGRLPDGASAGVACRSVANRLSHSYSNLGARLAFSRI